MVDRLYTDAELAVLYDDLNAGRPDFAFYLPLLMAAPSVLDAGCGTGALLHLARAAGHPGRLAGLDPAAAMLAVARDREPTLDWHHGTLATTAFHHEFDLIVMTGHAFQVLLTDDDLRTALAAVRAALTPTGAFAFETRNPAARTWETWPTELPRTVTSPTGTEITSRVDPHLDVTGDLVTFTQIYTSPGWPAPRLSPSTLRFLTPAHLDDFLMAAGLTVTHRYGGWDGAPFTSASPEVITLAWPT